MKKLIVSILLLFTLLIGATACFQTPTSESTSSESDSAPQTIYEQLDSFADVRYQQVKLDVLTVTGDIQLSASYTLTQNDVKYSVEQLNTLPEDGKLDGVSPNYKKTQTGTAKIIAGKVMQFDGQGVVLPAYEELKGSFHFDESNLKNVEMQENTLSADVISPSSFYGAEVDIQNVKICVEYTQTAFRQISITYQTASASVTTIYEFTV